LLPSLADSLHVVKGKPSGSKVAKAVRKTEQGLGLLGLLTTEEKLKRSREGLDGSLNLPTNEDKLAESSEVWLAP
jgi:hypothetical protein